jgi:hypothetical protein
LYPIKHYARASLKGSAPENNIKKTESVTLRFDTYTIDKLRKQAEEKQVSLNVMLNHIVTQHLDWHAHAADAGFISIRKNLIMNMLLKISEQEIVEMAKYTAKKDAKDFIMMLRNEYSITSALEILDTWLKIAGYSHRHEVRGTEHSYFIQHGMGIKWSLYLSELFRFIGEDFGLTRVDFDVGENTLSFRIDIGAWL